MNLAEPEALVSVGEIAERLATAVAATGALSREEALAIIEESPGLRPARALLYAGITMTTLQRAAWWHRGYEYVELPISHLPYQAMSLLPLPIARRARAVVLEADSHKAKVAFADPSDLSARDVAEQALAPLSIEVAVADEAAISEALRRYEAYTIAAPDEGSESSASTELEALVGSADLGSDSVAAKVVTSAINYAVKAGASDIHFLPRPSGLRIKLRLDGVLIEHENRDPSLGPGVVNRMKILSKMDIGTSRLPQDGQMATSVEGRPVDLRVTAIPTVWGTEDVFVRVQDHDAKLGNLDSLGLLPEALSTWRSLCRRSHGLLTVTGPTGSGKSTTLYATLGEIASVDKAVRTVEEPVEFHMPELTQIPVNPRAGLTFATALRSILRSDPDIILVGEIRDAETAKIAVEAALTGHLVLATLHTNAAVEASIRLIEMGVEPYLVAAALKGVMAQRLVRRLCPQCRMVANADAPWPAKEVARPAIWYEPKPAGCSNCYGSAYKGREAVAEVLEVNEEQERAIAKGASVSELAEIARRAGVTTMRTAGWRKVAAGVTSVAEVLRATES